MTSPRCPWTYDTGTRGVGTNLRCELAPHEGHTHYWDRCFFSDLSDRAHRLDEDTDA